jgi:hypothetical protein
VHVIHIRTEPHRFERFSAAARIDATADLLTVDFEVHHCLHAHRLHDIQHRRKLAILVAAATPWLGDVLGPQPEYQFLQAGARLILQHVGTAIY